MSEVTQEEVAGSGETQPLTGADLIREETGAEGRYIPYGGGSLGWFENSGVLKCERGNNYQFHTAVDTQKIRQKLFERWGNDVNRRMDTRHEVTKQVPVRVTTDGKEFDVETKDLSAHGLRLQLLEDPVVQSGEKVTVRVFRDSAYRNEALALEAEVMWVARVGKRRLVWNVGLSFTDISPEMSRNLQAFLLE